MEQVSRCNIGELDKPYLHAGRSGLNFDGYLTNPGLNQRGAEATLPDWAQGQLKVLRQEITSLRKNLEPKNAEIRRLRSQLRLLNRVMRLKNEESQRTARLMAPALAALPDL